MSAISVIGDKYVRAIIESMTPEDIACGAFLVKFYKMGDEPEYVIIDNYFPQRMEYGKEIWAFVTSENPEELWPMVLEKAYAKLYGSYENIEAGKVSFALADLTSGAPEDVKLESASDNIEALWEKILTYHKLGYLMGAGSPDHEMGDRAINENGIV